jgi:hypothetical protein
MRKLVYIFLLLGITVQAQFVALTGAIADQGSGLNPNIVSNGTFDDGTDWSLTTGWAIGGGTLNGTSTTALASQTSPAIAPTNGVTYDISFDITAHTEGNLRVRVGGTSTSTITISGTGNYTSSVVSGADGFIRIDDGGTGGAFTGSIDNLEIREQ